MQSIALLLSLYAVLHDGAVIGHAQRAEDAYKLCIAAGPGACELVHDNGVRVAAMTGTNPATYTDDYVPMPEDGSVVYVCDGGEAGGSFEPSGNDSFDGLSMEGAVRTLERARQVAKGLGRVGTDMALCEGGTFHDQQLVIDWGGGTATDWVVVTYYVNRDGKPHWGDPGARGCGSPGEPDCPTPEGSALWQHYRNIEVLN